MAGKRKTVKNQEKDMKKITFGDVTGITPSGKKEITTTDEVSVGTYATAQVVDANLIAANIKKDVTILGVTGTYEGEGGE